VLRDSQNYVYAAAEGIGLYEMSPSRVRPDIEQLDKIIKWLDGWPERRRISRTPTGVKRKPFSKVSFLRKPQAGSA
jgi:hypothetical protein